jgi:hypothetical protein
MSTPRDAEGRVTPPPEGNWERFLQRALGEVRKVLSRAGTGTGALELATVLALLGAGLLIIAEFLNVFEIRAAGLVVKQQSGGDQHSYALVLIGAAILAATLAARSSEQWPPAVAGIALALIALAIALIADLPDATRTDLVTDGRLASAHPAVGFWIELTGAILSLGAGGALAYLLRR